ncbi:MAG: NAD-dependent epimerase/dehydratase family protein [Saprospiraceae bacterium]|nr:NAD-dependent epimerase/dehydratase family protein [Saprospiraceae bacterium]
MGSSIVRLLIHSGYTNLVCLKRRESKMDLSSDFQNKVSWVEGDVLDLTFLMDAIKDIDCIVHVASIVTFSTKDRKKILQVAKDGTANLVNIALDKNIKKFIHISSVAAIGRKKPIEIIDEKNIFSHSKYDTTYGLSKFLSEQEVWRGHAEGLNVTILNPSMILGYGRWSESSVQIFKKVFNGLQFYPAGTTGWVDVNDVAEAVVKSMTLDQNGERFIISAENLSYGQVMNDIAQNLNVKGPQKVLNLSFADIIWRLEAVRSFFTGTSPLISKETMYSTSVQSSYNNTKSKNMLKMTYRPLQLTIKEVCSKFLTDHLH